MERNEQAPMSDEYPLMAFIANEGVAPKGERYDRSSLVNDTVGKLYKKTEFGDFIYSSNNLETGSIGLNKYGNASISPVYSIFQLLALTLMKGDKVVESYKVLSNCRLFCNVYGERYVGVFNRVFRNRCNLDSLHKW